MSGIAVLDLGQENPGKDSCWEIFNVCDVFDGCSLS